MIPSNTPTTTPMTAGSPKNPNLDSILSILTSILFNPGMQSIILLNNVANGNVVPI